MFIYTNTFYIDQLDSHHTEAKLSFAPLALQHNRSQSSKEDSKQGK